MRMVPLVIKRFQMTLIITVISFLCILLSFPWNYGGDLHEQWIIGSGESILVFDYNIFSEVDQSSLVILKESVFQIVIFVIFNMGYTLVLDIILTIFMPNT